MLTKSIRHIIPQVISLQLLLCVQEQHIVVELHVKFTENNRTIPCTKIDNSAKQGCASYHIRCSNKQDKWRAISYGDHRTADFLRNTTL